MRCALIVAYQFPLLEGRLHNSSYGVDCRGTRANRTTQCLPTQRLVLLVLLLRCRPASMLQLRGIDLDLECPCSVVQIHHHHMNDQAA